MPAHWMKGLVPAALTLFAAGPAAAYCTTRSDAPFFWDIKTNPVFNMTITLQNDGVCQIAAWESLGKIKEIRIIRRPTTGRFEFLYAIPGLRYTPHPSRPANDAAEIRFCAERFGSEGCVTIRYNYAYGY